MFDANRAAGSLDLTLRPVTSLLIDNTYILTRLTDRATGASIFNNHIIRPRWNWQFSWELSLRFIAQCRIITTADRLISSLTAYISFIPPLVETRLESDADACDYPIKSKRSLI